MKLLIDPGQSEWGWHRLDTLRCLRKYGYQYVEESPRTSSDALVFGTLVHTALAHHYKNDEEHYLSPLDAVARKLELMAEAGEVVGSLKDLQDRTVWFYKEYVHEYAQDPGWKVIAVEHELRMNVTDEENDCSYLFTQRADLIFESQRTGQVYIVDHKTAARTSPRVLNRYAIDGQMIGYQVFGQAIWGKKFGGVLLNMLQKPSKTSNYRWKFSRSMVTEAPQMVRDFKAMVLHRRRALSKWVDTDIPVSSWPAAMSQHICWTAYGPCPYTEKCRLGGPKTQVL